MSKRQTSRMGCEILAQHFRSCSFGFVLAMLAPFVVFTNAVQAQTTTTVTTTTTSDGTTTTTEETTTTSGSATVVVAPAVVAAPVYGATGVVGTARRTGRRTARRTSARLN